jgi:hypothetical protein
MFYAHSLFGAVWYSNFIGIGSAMIGIARVIDGNWLADFPQSEADYSWTWKNVQKLRVLCAKCNINAYWQSKMGPSPVCVWVHLIRSAEVENNTLGEWFLVCSCLMWAWLAQSVQRLATTWTVRGSNLGGGVIFRTRPHRPWGPPSLLHNWYRVIPRGKAAEAWHWRPISSSAEVKERVQLYLYSPLCLHSKL